MSSRQGPPHQSPRSQQQIQPTQQLPRQTPVQSGYVIDERNWMTLQNQGIQQQQVQQQYPPVVPNSHYGYPLPYYGDVQVGYTNPYSYPAPVQYGYSPGYYQSQPVVPMRSVSYPLSSSQQSYYARGAPMPQNIEQDDFDYEENMEDNNNLEEIEREMLKALDGDTESSFLTPDELIQQDFQDEIDRLELVQSNLSSLSIGDSISSSSSSSGYSSGSMSSSSNSGSSSTSSSSSSGNSAYVHSGAMPSQNGKLSRHAKEFWFPESRNCTCCNGYKHGCQCCQEYITTCTMCTEGDTTSAPILPVRTRSAPEYIQTAPTVTPAVSHRSSSQGAHVPSGAMPSQGGKLSRHAKEFWFPESRDCICCNGYKHGCKCCQRDVELCKSCSAGQMTSSDTISTPSDSK